MIHIGSRRELFVDDYLVDKEKTTAQTVLCRPVKREAVFTFDMPHEQSGTVYHNIFRDANGKYFMYYKANAMVPSEDGGGLVLKRHICMLESDDGLHWIRPSIISDTDSTVPCNNLVAGPDNMFGFYDTNPDCPENRRYKGIYGQWHDYLVCYMSADGYRFDVQHPTILQKTADTHCYYDSLNTMFYDEEQQKYVAFVRGLHIGDNTFPADPDDLRVVRDVRYTESRDFVNWSYPEQLRYQDDYDYQLYTNTVHRYYRAPHLYLGIPTRYTQRTKWNDSFEKLCGAEERRTRSRGMCLTDAILMSSRDGVHWHRFHEAMFVPGPEQPLNWAYGDCYVCIGMVETPSEIAGSDPELSMFCKEDRPGQPTTLYRYSLRMDGFVAVRSGYEPKLLVTKPFVFTGAQLEVNFETSAAGYLKFTLRCEEDGRELHSDYVFGDKIDRIVGFEDGSAAEFAGKPVTMTVALCDASLYAFRFC